MDAIDVVKEAGRAAASQVPILGPVLSGVFAARAKEVQERRLMAFLELLRAEAASYLQEQFPPGYLESQDYLHLILLALEHARRTRREEKQRHYARALLNAGTHAWAPRCDLAEELLNALADLSHVEIRVLQAAWEYSAEQPSATQDAGALRGTVTAGDIAPRLAGLGLAEAELRAYLGKLQRLGFTEEVVGALLGYGGGRYRLTLLLDRLIEFIKVPT